MDNKSETVTIVIPTRNEERFIAQCLDSIYETTFPRDQFEVIVVDGMSTDATREIVGGFVAKFPNLRFLVNRKKNIPAALNLGIQSATGEYIIRMDAHSTYAPDYIGICVDLLRTTGAGSVGGLQRTEGTSYVSKAIARAMSSRFGAGDAQYRFAKKRMWVDTVYLGAWRRSTLLKLGGYDENWLVNEDYELNVRLRNQKPFNEEFIVNQDYLLNYELRERGFGVLLAPELKSTYFVRPSLRKLAKQYFRYGYWKVRTLVVHPQSARWRQLVSPVFVLSLLLSLALIPWTPIPAVVIGGAYLSATLAFSILTAASHGWTYLPLLPVVFAILHISWGLGFLAGLGKWGIPKRLVRNSLRSIRDRPRPLNLAPENHASSDVEQRRPDP